MDAEVQAALNTALTESKIAPANREHFEKFARSDFDGFKAFCSAAPEVVPKGERVTAALKT